MPLALYILIHNCLQKSNLAGWMNWSKKCKVDLS